MREIAKLPKPVVPATSLTYKPTQSEWAAIRKGEAEIARGESVSLADLVHELDRNRRNGGKKATRKFPVRDRGLSATGRSRAGQATRPT